ncbi:hypothetical protein C8R45DRAFT_1083005 [Mycena sanguinolenta]|nr:hypothetical protein C8R45DRAFT_1083005 [Mycena sanguinolenta]
MTLLGCGLTACGWSAQLAGAGFLAYFGTSIQGAIQDKRKHQEARAWTSADERDGREKRRIRANMRTAVQMHKRRTRRLESMRDGLEDRRKHKLCEHTSTEQTMQRTGGIAGIGSQGDCDEDEQEVSAGPASLKSE